jgi:hypothetical protein
MIRHRQFIGVLVGGPMAGDYIANDTGRLKVSERVSGVIDHTGRPMGRPEVRTHDYIYQDFGPSGFWYHSSLTPFEAINELAKGYSIHATSHRR